MWVPRFCRICRLDPVVIGGKDADLVGIIRLTVFGRSPVLPSAQFRWDMAGYLRDSNFGDVSVEGL